MSVSADNSLAAKAPAGVESGGSVDIGLWNRLAFEAVRVFLWGWTSLFSLKGLYRLGCAFGTLEWSINYKRRRRFAARFRETRVAPPTPRETRQACRRYFIRTRCDKMFYLIFDKLGRNKILNRVQFEGREHIEWALARGQGVYVCTSHHGSHHVTGFLLALMGYKAVGVRDRNEGAIRRFVQEKHAKAFPELRNLRLFLAGSFPRDLFRCFKENRILGSSMDIGRDRGSHLKTVPVRIFGRQREFLLGPMQIAVRCGAPIVQGFLISGKDFYFKIQMLDPLLVEGEDKPEVYAEVMQKYADNIEAHVREHPDHIARL